jgi:hypothetical protein
MQYKIDSFILSDRRIVCGASVDHVAWLKGRDGSKTVDILVQFSSRGVSDEDATTIVNNIVSALSE